MRHRPIVRKLRYWSDFKKLKMNPWAQVVLESVEFKEDATAVSDPIVHDIEAKFDLVHDINWTW